MTFRLIEICLWFMSYNFQSMLHVQAIEVIMITLCCAIRYYTIQNYNLLFYTMLFYTMLYYTILYYAKLC